MASKMYEPGTCKLTHADTRLFGWLQIQADLSLEPFPIKEGGTMNRSTLRSLIGGSALIVAAVSTVTFALLSTSSSAAAAQTAAQVSVTSVTMSVDEVRTSFVSGGFQVDLPHAWTWMNPPFTSLQIHDPASQRVLMLMVYPDSAAARTARTQALTHEPAAVEPHLIEGYGPSLWNGNVAMVQSRHPELDHLLQTRMDDASGVEVDTNLAWEHSVTADAVDMDFQQALDNAATVNL
jgi:hypothetical protein